QWLRRLGAKLGLERDWYLILVAAVIGLVMGNVAIAFISPLHWLEERATEIPAEWLIVLIPTVPILGALISGMLLNFVRLTDGSVGGPGVATVLYSIHRRQAQLPIRLGVRKWLASTATIGLGGSAGAEGPIVTIGSVIGSNVARLMRVNPQNTATLLGCGAAGGLAAVFNAPIAGIFFVMELLLRDFSLRTFTPIVIAAVIASAWARAYLGGDAIFSLSPDFRELIATSPELTLPQLPNFILLGVITGLAAAAFIFAFHITRSFFGKMRLHPVFKPAVGAVALGVLGLGFYLLTTKQAVPAFYGNGYSVIRDLLDPAWYHSEDGVLRSWHSLFGLLVALGVLKAIATCLTLGSGGAGGMFAPSLFMGAAIGGALGTIVNHVELLPAANPAVYAIVGMAAMVASTTHAPLTAILIVYEVTQSYEIILPLMLTAVIALIVGRLVFRDSVYMIELRTHGIRLGAMSDLTILRRLLVQNVPLVPALTVHSDDSAQRLLDLSERHAVTDFVVTNERNQYVGLVTHTDLQAALVFREAIPLLQVNELQRGDLPTVSPDESLDVVLDKFAKFDVQSLAVLEDGGDGKILGLITRSRLMNIYQHELSRE
ncbi:MAG: chloride channel protein, partial [Phycisphaerales bacterium]|nr:chloride channel protein [Phycisphaerales bacterium]